MFRLIKYSPQNAWLGILLLFFTSNLIALPKAQGAEDDHIEIVSVDYDAEKDLASTAKAYLKALEQLADNASNIIQHRSLTADVASFFVNKSSCRIGKLEFDSEQQTLSSILDNRVTYLHIDKQESLILISNSEMDEHNRPPELRLIVTPKPLTAALLNNLFYELKKAGIDHRKKVLTKRQKIEVTLTMQKAIFERLKNGLPLGGKMQAETDEPPETFSLDGLDFDEDYEQPETISSDQFMGILD